MGIHRSNVAAAAILRNPGKRSAQIVWPASAPDAKVTITRVTLEPGAVSDRHSHPASEQIWIVEAGEARLLGAGAGTSPMRAGDVVRAPPGEVHGIENRGSVPFTYLTITTPPEDMRAFYVGQDGF